jgi:hypothetical protein
MKAVADKEFLKCFDEIKAKYEISHDEYSKPGIRTRYVASIERRIWALWGYVRDNQNSLDSERACHMIRAGIDVAVGDTLAQMERLSEKIGHQNLEIERLSGELKAAKKQLAAKGRGDSIEAAVA